MGSKQSSSFEIKREFVEYSERKRARIMSDDLSTLTYFNNEDI
jgi:hypothetical protein